MTSTIKVDNIQDQDGNNIINENANTITIGASGDTVTLASGASQSGFGRTGTVDWDTTKKTANFTATSGEGYFCDTSGGAFTLTLPASPSAGDIVGIRDYASTFATNNLTIGRNGSNLNGNAADSPISTDNKSLTLVYVDSTQGWIPIEEGTGFVGEAFMTATGGTQTTCGDYRIHTFTSPGTFTVSSLASCSSNNVVEYLVVAGAGGSARDNAGGSGAGGMRFFATGVSPSPYPASPFVAPAGITVTAQSYPITVGGGGASGSSQSPNASPGSRGSDSIFSTITSTGGGGSIGDGQPTSPNQPGGSGGGRGQGGGGAGSGNVPSVSPPQGKDGGGTGANPGGGGGGGGFTVAGCNQSGDNGGAGGDGGGFPPGHFGSSNGVPCGSFRYFAGGGGGGNGQPGSGSGGAGGKGGGGAGSASSPGSPSSGTDGTANTGGGAGGGGQAGCGATGGSGIVIIRYKYQ
jgi:hypothetical protein